MSIRLEGNQNYVFVPALKGEIQMAMSKLLNFVRFPSLKKKKKKKRKKNTASPVLLSG